MDKKNNVKKETKKTDKKDTKSKKKIGLIIGIISAIIVVIVLIVTAILLTSSSIPKELQGEWGKRLYLIYSYDGTEYESDTNYILKIDAHSIKEYDANKPNSEYIEYNFEKQGEDYIISSKKSENTYKEYIILKDGGLYTSSDKDLKYVTPYYKVGSKEYKNAEYKYLADKYSERIEFLCNKYNEELDDGKNKTIYILDNNKEEDKEDLNYYDGKYTMDSGDLEIKINKNTGKLSYISYSRSGKLDEIWVLKLIISIYVTKAIDVKDITTWDKEKMIEAINIASEINDKAEIKDNSREYKFENSDMTVNYRTSVYSSGTMYDYWSIFPKN